MTGAECKQVRSHTARCVHSTAAHGGGELTLIRLGRGRSGVHVHQGFGAADIAEGDLAQAFQLYIAHTV